MGQFFVPFPNTWISREITTQIGKAVWLLLLLLDLTVRSIDDIGIVLGGQSIHDEDLYERLGVHRNTFTRYRKTLEEAGFIYTRVTRYALRQWFVIGSEKYRGKRAPERQVDLVQSIIVDIAASRPSDKSKILNPAYFDILNRFDASISKSRMVATNSGEDLTKNGATPVLIDNNTDESSHNSKERKIGASGHNPQPIEGEDLAKDEETDIHPEVHEVYQAYMKVMDSNSLYPNHSERTLIEEALTHEGFENLMRAISVYENELYYREGKWRVLAASEFFLRDRYSRFLAKPEPRESCSPPAEDDIPF